MKLNRTAQSIMAFALLLALFFEFGVSAARAQEVPPVKDKPEPSAIRYLDQQNGTTADEAVRIALENNGGLQALKQETEAARALLKQAGLRPNPKVEARAARQLGGADSQVMVEGMLPLELGGRRAARIRTAQVEMEIRELAAANQERLLAAETRTKFGEALALVKKLEITEKIIANMRQGYDLVAGKVAEGRTPPLEQNMLLVELNRLLSMRETAEGRVETTIFELKNLLGMKPDEPLRLKGDFENLLDDLPPLSESVEAALQTRPDLQGARALENLATARIERARAESRPEASVKTGYQRMRSGFPLSGVDDSGALQPIDSVFHFFTFGVEIDLPVRNRNQGEIEAAVFERQAAQSRIRFGELTIRREINAAYARHNRAVRARSIFQNGVREQADANLRVIWQTYEFGKNTLSVYIAEERRFLDIENEAVDALAETYAARVEILRTTGAAELIKK